MSRLGVCIQAGGQGSRLREVLGDRPKALAPLGTGTLLSYQLDETRALAPEVTVVLCHDRVEQLVLPPDVLRIVEPSPLDTAGGLALLPDEPDTWLVVNVDHVSDVDRAGLVGAHVGAATALVHHKRHTVPEGVVTVRDGRVIDYRERPPLDLQVTAGLYVFSRAALGQVLDGGPLSMPELIRRLVPLGVGAWEHRGFWIDAGTPQRLAQAERFLSEGR